MTGAEWTHYLCRVTETEKDKLHLQSFVCTLGYLCVAHTLAQAPDLLLEALHDNHCHHSSQNVTKYVRVMTNSIVFNCSAVLAPA